MYPDWEHEVEVAWLEARREVITATELARLRPKLARMTNAQRMGKQPHPDFVMLYGSKQESGRPDPRSFGAAARGHVMEPYAVREFNHRAEELGWEDVPHFYHWDDMLIVCPGLGAGYSPDAMDASMTAAAKEAARECVAGLSELTPRPTAMLEVKCYDAAHHYKAGMTEPSSLPERYQVAAAMCVDRKIERGWLAFYNPGVPDHMFTVGYTREELADEVAELDEVLRIWHETVRAMARLPRAGTPLYTEDQIHDDMLADKDILQL